MKYSANSLQSCWNFEVLSIFSDWVSCLATTFSKRGSKSHPWTLFCFTINTYLERCMPLTKRTKSAAWFSGRKNKPFGSIVSTHSLFIYQGLNIISYKERKTFVLRMSSSSWNIKPVACVSHFSFTLKSLFKHALFQALRETQNETQNLSFSDIEYTKDFHTYDLIYC